MKRFIVQLFFFFVPVTIFLGLFFNDFRVMDGEILNDELEGKISALKIDTSKPNIIIVGDSRAERQLVPKIIKEKTGINTINLATSGCDLVTVNSALKKIFPNCAKIIFIVSATSWQVNDGAIDDALSLKSFQSLNFIEKISLFRNSLPNLIGLQKALVVEFLKRKLHRHSIIYKENQIVNELGFRGIEGNIKIMRKDSLQKFILTHPWYKNNQNNGYRWGIFQKSLTDFKAMNSFFYIFQPPICPYWRTNTSNKFIDSAEIAYSKKLALEVKTARNIIFYDFYSNEINDLNDSMFYDYQHLNRTGAELFSNLIAKRILTNLQSIKE